MSRRYTPQEKARAIDLLHANNGDIIKVFALTGIPERTLSKWRSQNPVKPRLPALRVPVPDAPTAIPPDIQKLVVLQAHLMKHAAALVQSLADDIQDASLSQRAAALNQVLTTIIRLATFIPPDSQDSEVLRIEYKDADGTIHSSPPWARNDSEVEGALQSGGVWSPFWQDGNGEDPAG